jgi:hypothetical protein
MSDQAKEPASGRTDVVGAPFTFGVSGHRDLVSTDLPELRKQIRLIFDHYRSAYPDASFRLLSPLAEGADRVAAEVALTSDVQVWVPMPMAQPEYERDFTTAESLADFRRLLDAAHSRWEMNDGSRNPALLTDGAVRAQRYAAVGDYIAQKSHVLILLWDGRHNLKLGGTSWVMKRREHWVNAAAEGGGPDVFGYVGTIHVVTSREATESGSQPRRRVEIAGGLPPLGAGQTDERSRL